MGRNREGVGPLAHGIAAFLSSGSFAWRENDFDVQSKVTGEKARVSNRSRERRVKKLGNTLLMALLCVQEGLLAGGGGVWRTGGMRWGTGVAFCKLNLGWPSACSTGDVVYFALSQHTNRHMDTVTDTYTGIALVYLSVFKHKFVSDLMHKQTPLLCPYLFTIISLYSHELLSNVHLSFPFRHRGKLI